MVYSDGFGGVQRIRGFSVVEWSRDALANEDILYQASFEHHGY